MQRIFSINNSRSRNAILAALILSYLLIELFQINLGGLFFDDAIDGALTVQIIKNDIGADGFRVFGWNLPLMLSKSHSALTSYLLLPVFHLFGIHVLSLRLFTIFFGVLTLLFMYLFSLLFLNQKAALIATALLAFNFTFITGTRMGFNNGSITMAILMCSPLLFLKWYLRKKNLYLFLGVFLLGIGVSIRLWFAWFPVALCICALIFRKDLMRNFKAKDNLYIEIFLGFLSFFLGSFLLFYYNFFKNLSSLKYFLDNFPTGEGGINNLAYLKNLSIRARHVFEVLTNTDWGLGFGGLTLLFFLIPIGWLLFVLLFRKKTFFPRKRILFLFILIISIFLQSPFTPSDLSSLHMVFILPLFILLVSAGITEFGFYFKRKITTVLAIFFVLFFLKAEAYKNFAGYVYFRDTGGKHYNSDAVNALANWLLRETGYKKIIIVSGKIYHALTVLSGAKLYDKIIDYTYGCHCYENEKSISEEQRKGFADEFERLVMEGENLYVEVVPAGNKYWTCDRILNEIIEKDGLKIIEKKVFFQKQDNVALYRVFTIK